MKTAKRLTAVLVAVIMFVSLSQTMAESRPMPGNRAIAVLEEGKSIETTANVTVDGQTVAGLIGMFSGGQSDPQMQTIMDTVISAINKMQVNALMSKNAASGKVGTAQGDMFDFSGMMDIQTGESAMVTSLLPGHVLKIAPELIRPMLEQSATLQVKPEQVMQMMGKYMDAASAYYENNIKPDLNIQEGAFTVDRVGEYTMHITGQPTSRHLAGMMLALEKVAREDDALKEMFASLTAAMSQQGMDDDDMPEDFEDMLDEVKEAAEEMLDDEEQTLVTLDIYMNAATNASYVQAETPVMEGSATHVSVINNPSETGAQVEVSVLVKTPMPSYSADGTQVAPALETPIDWQKVRQDIISGQDPTGVMIDVTMDSSEDTAANKMATDAQIKIQASGMPFTISITGDETLTGNYEANNSFSIAVAVLSPAPLITFTQKSVQTDKQPALPDMSNLTEVVLSEEMTEEDMAPLTKILTEQTLPQLMENLKKALPEEAGILMLLLQPQPEEGAITQVN